MKMSLKLLNITLVIILSAFSQTTMAKLPLATLKDAVESAVLQTSALTSSIVAGTNDKEMCYLAGRLTTGLLQIEKASYEAEMSNNVQAYLKILRGKISTETLAKVATSDMKTANELLRTLLFAQSDATDLAQDLRKNINVLLPLIRKAEQVGDLNRSLQASFCTKHDSKNFISMITEISEQVLELHRDIRAEQAR